MSRIKLLKIFSDGFFDLLRRAESLLILTLIFPAFVLADDRPNIIVLLCDDLGFGDIGCYGHPHIRTPNLDAMAQAGLLCQSFYSAAPVCSPSRVGLLTGRSPNRAGVYDWIPAAEKIKPDARDQVHMRQKETTMARLLKQSGYDTAMAGKWHCNSRFDSNDQPQPNDHGFDHWFATQNNASPSHKDPKNFVRNGQPVGPLDGFSCQIVMDEALNWLNKRQEKKSDQNTNPFFLYIAFHEPHEPVASPEKLVNSYLGITQSREQAEYFANVTNVDLAVGRLLDRLKKTRLDENTLVIFTSDNGPETLNRYRSANRSFGTPGLLKGMKLWTNEAGFRVAGIFYWPGKIKSGRTSVPLSALDLLPTFCSFADSELPKNLKLDGMDISSFLMGEELEQSRPLIWAYYNSINKQRVAMRFKNWKVLATIDGGRFPKVQNIHNGIIERLRSAVLTDFEIYDVTADIGETKNLVTSLPEGPKLIGLIQQEYQNLLQDSYVWQRHR